jgi:GT2 family glycosyltransferase
MENKQITISVILITYGRKEDLKSCLNSILKQEHNDYELIIIDNNEDELISNYLKELISKIKDEDEDIDKIRYYKMNKNLGVTGGRNFGIKRAKGDILVFIDDDAFLENKNALQKVYSNFFRDSQIGALSFKIVNYYSKKIERKEFPHKNKRLNPDKQFETSYFIGAGHAIKKEIFDKIGLYPEDFFYGMEELDLSFKIIDNGYKIYYYPEVIVWHKQSLEGRLTEKEKWQKILENRIKVSIRNLPWKYIIINTLIWSVKVFIEVKGDFTVVFKSYRNIFRERKNILKVRKVINLETLSKLKKLRGRLYY